MSPLTSTGIVDDISVTRMPKFGWATRAARESLRLNRNLDARLRRCSAHHRWHDNRESVTACPLSARSALAERARHRNGAVQSARCAARVSGWEARVRRRLSAEIAR